MSSVLFSYGPSFHTSSAQAIYWGDRKIKDRYKTVWKECTCILFSLHGFDAICCSGSNRTLGYLWKSKLVLRSNLICCRCTPEFCSKHFIFCACVWENMFWNKSAVSWMFLGRILVHLHFNDINSLLFNPLQNRVTQRSH